MTHAAYLALWLLLLLAAVAVLSAALTRPRRLLRSARRAQAARLLQALAHYESWVDAQRGASTFEGESAQAAQALDEACALRMAWFPELAADMAELLALHQRLLQFLAAQHALRLADVEAWLESDHDARFAALWREQRAAADAMRRKLARLARVQAPPPAGPASSFA